MISKKSWIRIKTKIIEKYSKERFWFNYEAITMVKTNKFYDVSHIALVIKTTKPFRSHEEFELFPFLRYDTINNGKGAYYDY